MTNTNTNPTPTVSREVYQKVVREHAVPARDRTHEGMRICAVEHFDSNGKLIASALYSRSPAPGQPVNVEYRVVDWDLMNEEDQ